MSPSSRSNAPALGIAVHTPQPSGLFERLAAPVRRWFEREALKHELNTLDPRVLQDLGINKGDFGAILAGTLKRPQR